MVDRINKTVLVGIIAIIFGVGMIGEVVDGHDSIWMRIGFGLLGIVIACYGNSLVNKGINEEVKSAIREHELTKRK